MNQAKQRELFRMILWLLFGLLFYAASYAIGNGYPVPQIVCQKLGNVTTFAFVGYWIARTGVGRLHPSSMATEKQARAIVIGCAMLAGALGL